MTRQSLQRSGSRSDESFGTCSINLSVLRHGAKLVWCLQTCKSVSWRRQAPSMKAAGARTISCLPRLTGMLHNPFVHPLSILMSNLPQNDRVTSHSRHVRHRWWHIPKSELAFAHVRSNRQKLLVFPMHFPGSLQVLAQQYGIPHRQFSGMLNAALQQACILIRPCATWY